MGGMLAPPFTAVNQLEHFKLTDYAKKQERLLTSLSFVRPQLLDLF
jgi:hypothetical protein